MSVSVIDLDTHEIVEIWCRYREPIVTLVFDASDFTKPEKKEQPASKKDEATVKPAEIEVSVPERTPRFLQRESEVCEGLGASPCKDLLKAPAIHLDLYKAPAADWSGSRRLTAKSEFSLSGPLFFM